MTEETKKKVLEVIEKTGYMPNFFAQGMRRHNNRCICIISEELLQFSTPPIVEAIIDVCEEKGYRTFLINMSMYEKWKKTGRELGEDKLLSLNTSPALTEAKAMRADGVIYVAAHGHPLNNIPEDFDIPTVFVYGYSNDNRFRSVLIDDFDGGALVARYLVDNGHRNIGVIAGKKDNIHTIERLNGYKSVLAESGLDYDPGVVYFGDWERGSGKKFARKLLDQGITTIWCMNDLMAAGVYDEAVEEGLAVGKDISVFGFDNREISKYMYPMLSTCELPLESMGRTAAEIMIKEIEDENYRKEKAHDTKVPCKLVLRESIVL